MADNQNSGIRFNKNIKYNNKNAEKMKNSELDEILNDMKQDGKIEEVKSFSALRDKSISNIVSLNFDQIKQNAQEFSDKHIDAIANFYLADFNLDLTEGFIWHKMNRDKYRLAKQIVQLEIAEHSIAKLNEEIDNGNFNPRLWEVMGGLMRSFDNLNITYAKMEILIENNYKIIQEEIDFKKATLEEQVNLITEDNNINSNTNSNKNPFILGHKALLQQINTEIKQENVNKNKTIK